MPTYETIFISLPTLTEEDESSLVSTFSEVVTGDGGNLVTTDRIGRRRLAYPIRKHEDGVYTRLLYDAEPAVPKELERRFRLSDKILRHLTVRLEPGWAVAAKEQAVRDEQARIEAAKAAEAAAREAERKAAEEAAKAAEEAAKAEAEGVEAGSAETESTDGAGDDAPASDAGDAKVAKAEAAEADPAKD